VSTKFIIICPGRSGSTVLRETLNCHPDICSHGELLGRNRILGYSPKGRIGAPLGANAFALRQRNLPEFLEQYAFAADTRVVGFKLLYYQVGEVQFGEAMETLRAMTNLQYIVLWRRNLVLRYASELMFGREKELLPMPHVEAVKQDCRNQIALRARMYEYFPLAEAHRVAYEDLLAEPRAVLDGICEFLGVATGVVDLPQKRRAAGTQERKRGFFKTVSDRLDGGELRAALTSHPELQEFVDLP